MACLSVYYDSVFLQFIRGFPAAAAAADIYTDRFEVFFAQLSSFVYFYLNRERARSMKKEKRTIKKVRS